MDSSKAVTPPYLATPLRLEPFCALMLAPHRVGNAAAARAFGRPYRDVASRLRRWETSGRVTRDLVPAIYLHEYTAGGITIRGLVGALDTSRRAEDLAGRAVLPHEGIYPYRARDLAERMAKMRLDPAPILLVHRGPTVVRELVGSLMQTPAERSFVDHAQQQHRIWRIRGEGLAVIARALSSSRPMIADGHHRYAAYLQLQQAHPGTGWDRGLAMLVDQDDTPLFLGAIHRVLRSTRMDELMEATSDTSHALVPCTREQAIAALHADVLAVTDGQAWATLSLKLDPGRSAVEELHGVLVGNLPSPERDVTYHHSLSEALDRVRPGRDLALAMPAPDFDLVHEIVAHQRLLPEKATSFQPKPSTGVLMRSVGDESPGRA